MAAAKFDPAFPWEIRHAECGGMQSKEPYCGYSLATLKSMASNGYYLYHEGKKVKLSGLTDAIITKARKQSCLKH